MSVLYLFLSIEYNYYKFISIILYTIKYFRYVIGDCNPHVLISETVKILSLTKKQYQYGPGMKVTFKTQRERFYHMVFFSNAPLFIDIADFQEGDFCTIKANVLKSGDEHSLINIFDIKKLD